MYQNQQIKKRKYCLLIKWVALVYLLRSGSQIWAVLKLWFDFYIKFVSNKFFTKMNIQRELSESNTKQVVNF